jgi:hypothetical protein
LHLTYAAHKEFVTTTFERLLALGWTEQQIRTASGTPSAREFTVAVVDTPDDFPIVGIAYGCDYRSEEEAGSTDLYRKIRGDDPNLWKMRFGSGVHIRKFAGLHALALSVHELAADPVWGQDIRILTGTGPWNIAAQAGGRWYDDCYDSHFAYGLHYVHGLPGQRLQYRSVTELRHLAKTFGIRPLPTKKDLLVDAIQSSPAYAASAASPNKWPGWFHNGTTLVLRADRGIVADVLDLLFEASERGTFAVGGAGGSNPFGSGMAFYDALDVGPKLERERFETAVWTARWNKKLETVKAELKSRGHGWYALDGPSEIGGTVKFWLNGHSRGGKQPFGWFTLEELLAEKFITESPA